MTLIDKDRVFIFRRIINEDYSPAHLKILSDLKDEELLDIINASALPNVLSKNAFKFSLFFNFLLYDRNISKNKVMQEIDDIKHVCEVMSKGEKEIVKFGLFRGYSGYNWRYHMSRFMKVPLRPDESFASNRKISSYTFQRVFAFAYKLIFKGEKNEQFPRL